MIYLKTPTKGIDISIQGFQKVLYSYLKSIWPVNDSNFDCYGRAYRNQTDDGYIPEVFIGAASIGSRNASFKDYAEVFFNDNRFALCFFGVGESTSYKNGTTIARVFLIVMVRIQNIKPSNNDHRADEEIRNDVEKFAVAKRFGFMYTGTETGIDNVFKEYSGWRKKEGMKHMDMHPQHCFRLNFDLIYNINQC